MEQMQDICRRSVGPLERTERSATDIVRNLVKSVDKDLPEGDIIRSHRVIK